MASDYFLAALDESELELKIRESEPKILDGAYNRALPLEKIRRGSQRKDQVVHLPGENGTSVRSRLM